MDQTTIKNSSEAEELTNTMSVFKTQECDMVQEIE